MKNRRAENIFLRSLLLFFLLLSLSPLLSKQGKEIEMSIFSTGFIHWSGGYIVAEGIGKAPKKGSPAQKKLAARRAATVIAYRNLLWIVSQLKWKGKSIASRARKNKKLRVKLDGFVQGAVVVRESYKDGLYYMRLQVPLNGVNGAASLILPSPHRFQKAQKIGTLLHFKRKKV